MSALGRRLFVDTGAFVALRNQGEREHDQARATLKGLVADGAQLFTSNLVFAETYTALLIRVGRDEAIEWGRRMRARSSIDVIRIDSALEDATWEILDAHGDKRWSYVDASSFALMESEGVEEAFTFDHHFAQRGLVVRPPQT